MKKLILILIVAGIFNFLNNSAKAQTAVYLCTETGAFGYCYGNNDVATCAYNSCISYGGTYPSSFFSHYAKGYGAIAVGTSSNGARVVGASAGYSNPTDAKNRAIRECTGRGGYNVYVLDSWNDEY